MPTAWIASDHLSPVADTPSDALVATLTEHGWTHGGTLQAWADNVPLFLHQHALWHDAGRTTWAVARSAEEADEVRLLTVLADGMIVATHWATTPAGAHLRFVPPPEAQPRGTNAATTLAERAAQGHEPAWGVDQVGGMRQIALGLGGHAARVQRRAAAHGAPVVLAASAVGPVVRRLEAIPLRRTLERSSSTLWSVLPALVTLLVLFLATRAMADPNVAAASLVGTLLGTSLVLTVRLGDLASSVPVWGFALVVAARALQEDVLHATPHALAWAAGFAAASVLTPILLSRHALGTAPRPHDHWPSVDDLLAARRATPPAQHVVLRRAVLRAAGVCFALGVVLLAVTWFTRESPTDWLAPLPPGTSLVFLLQGAFPAGVVLAFPLEGEESSMGLVVFFATTVLIGLVTLQPAGIPLGAAVGPLLVYAIVVAGHVGRRPGGH